jgi:hypothetical protein
MSAVDTFAGMERAHLKQLRIAIEQRVSRLRELCESGRRQVAAREREGYRPSAVLNEQLAEREYCLQLSIEAMDLLAQVMP